MTKAAVASAGAGLVALACACAGPATPSMAEWAARTMTPASVGGCAE